MFALLAGVSLGYSQLTDADIVALPVPELQSDGFLFIWVINAKYKFTLDLFQHWGYECVLPFPCNGKSCASWCQRFCSQTAVLSDSAHLIFELLQAGGRDCLGEDDSQQAAGQESWILPAACKGGLPCGEEGQRPTWHEG